MKRRPDGVTIAALLLWLYILLAMDGIVGGLVWVVVRIMRGY